MYLHNTNEGIYIIQEEVSIQYKQRSLHNTSEGLCTIQYKRRSLYNTSRGICKPIILRGKNFTYFESYSYVFFGIFL